jgi:hypothetical protein
MIGGRALGAAAVSDAGLRDLASEYPGPQVDAVRSVERGRAAGSQAGERRVTVRRDVKVG